MAILAALAAAAFGQAAAPRFEVASVKANAQDGADVQGLGTVRFLNGGRLNAEKAQLRYIILNAYGVKSFQLLGGPGWIESAHYDIDAKASDQANPGDLRRMLLTLLEERFQLQAHRETRQLPVYELSAAKSGLKLPPPKQANCAGAGGDGPPMPGEAPCGRIVMTFSAGGARMLGAQVPMAELLRVLSNVLARTVVDRTGFTGLFDVRLEFSPDSSLGGLPTPAGADDPRVPTIPADPNHPGIFAALQQQLGIRVEAAKGPVEVVVIDRVERPSEN